MYTFEPIFYRFVSILVYVHIQLAKPTLRTNHILSLSINIFIYTHLNRYICKRLCLYLYMRVFRWRNQHFEKITFGRYPYIYIHTFEPIYLYTFVSILYMAYLGRETHSQNKSHFVVIHNIHIHTLEPIHIPLSLYCIWRIQVANSTLRTNHIVSLYIFIDIYIHI